MYKYRISLIAAACIYCYRYEHKIKPLWTDICEQITGYNEDYVCEISKEILKKNDESSIKIKINTSIRNETGKYMQNKNISVENKKRTLNVYELYMNC